MSNFGFFQKEFFAICDSATKAEGYLNTDARAACWYAPNQDKLDEERRELFNSSADEIF